MEPVVQTSWLDADDYASVVVTKESAAHVIAFDLTRNRALQLLARASRQRRRRSTTEVRGQLALLRAA